MNPDQQLKINTAAPSRRDFFSRAALTGAATLGVLALTRPALARTTTNPPLENAGPPGAAGGGEAKPATEQAMPPAPPAVAESDIAILNFALGLERLEAAFYAQIQGAQQTRAYLSPRQIESARDIGAIEISHVTTLESAILGAGGTLPATQIYRFPANVFISPVAFSWFGYTLEEIGIGAYLGAVGQIQSRDLRKAAASIYGAEVRHAALLRSFGGFTFAPRYFESPLTVEQVQTLVAPYIS